MEILAIIPARAGSKGLPNKNILPLNGQPLLSYSIAAGIQTPEIKRVICSTDSQNIANIAKNFGAEVPFLRPTKYAQDMSQDIDLFEHALKWLKDNNSYVPDLVINLRPTSPIRYIKDIQKAISLINSDEKIDSVRSISTPPTTPYKMWKKKSSILIEPLLKINDNPEPFNSPRQALPIIWAQTGSIEVIRERTISNLHSMSGNNIAGLEVSEDTYIDIDTINSMQLAEVVLSKLDCIKP